MATYFANPYDITAHGFYFETWEEYEEKSQEMMEREHPVEEFEIEIIDADCDQIRLFNALEISQATLEDWFSPSEWDEGNLDEYEVAAACFLAEMDNYGPRQIDRDMIEDCSPFKGDLVEWAEEFIDSTGMLDNVPEEFRRYFDVEAWAQDAELSGDVAEFQFCGDTWVMFNH